MSSRFTPSPFQYNTRVSLALLPCLAILAGFGGNVSVCIGMVGHTSNVSSMQAQHKPTKNPCHMTCVISLSHVQVGAMIIYILDAVQHREAALLAVWLCLGLMNMSFALTVLFFTSNSSRVISVLMAIMNGITLFMTGEQLGQQLMHTPGYRNLSVCLTWQ